MSGSVTAKLSASLVGAFTGSSVLSSILQQISQQLSLDVQPGTGVGQGNELYAAARTLAASASENLDLSGALVDAFGATIVFTDIIGIVVFADKGNTNNVLVGNAASNGFVGPAGATGVLTLKPGDWAVLASQTGWTVTAATGDLLKVANSGGTTSVLYSIILIGR